MSSLGVPDVNVWLALLLEDHIHRNGAVRWWQTTPLEVIAFSRFTQMGVLRLLTTAVVMNNKPLTMAGAWKAYDYLFADGLVTLLPEPASLEDSFRMQSTTRRASPKLWADAWLTAFAKDTGGSLVTFDRALAKRSPDSVLLGSV
jgi:toxin-antitoxin system PIN domain toxin